MIDTVKQIRLGIEENLFRMLGRFPEIATRHDYYLATAYTVRDWMLRRWVRTAATYFEHASRTVA